MAWRTMAVRDQRVEFVVRAHQGQQSLSQLCAEFGISRPTGHLWLKRYREQGVIGIEEHSRRPQHCPRQTAPSVEERIAQLRRQRPDWGTRPNYSHCSVARASSCRSLPCIAYCYGTDWCVPTIVGLRLGSA